MKLFCEVYNSVNRLVFMAKNAPFFLFLVFTLGIHKSIFSQNSSYAPFYYNAMDYNPASTGVKLGVSGTLSHQHNFNNSPFPSYSTNLNGSFYDRKLFDGALGISVHSSIKRKSLFAKNQIGLSYAKRKKFSPNCILQVGIKGSFVHKQADSYSSLNLFEYKNAFPDSDFDTIPLINTTQHHFNFLAGALVMFNIKPTPVKTLATTIIGIGFNNLNTPKEQWVENHELTVHLKTNIHMKTRMVIYRDNFYGRKFFLIPALLYEYNNPIHIFSLDASEVKELTFGTNFEFPVRKLGSCIHTGFWMKNYYMGKDAEHFNITQNQATDSYSFLLGLERRLWRRVKQSARFSYSFDIPRDGNKPFSKAIHEFSLSIDLMNIALPRRVSVGWPIRRPTDTFFYNCNCCGGI